MCLCWFIKKKVRAFDTLNCAIFSSCADRSFGRSVDRLPDARSLGSSVDRSVAWSIARSLDRSLQRSHGRSLGRSVDRSIGRSVARSLARSLDRSIARSLDRSLDRSIERSLDHAIVRSRQRSIVTQLCLRSRRHPAVGLVNKRYQKNVFVDAMNMYMCVCMYMNIPVTVCSK